MSKVWKFGADVDTDQMAPGRCAPYMRSDKDVGDVAFIEARPDSNRGAQPGDLIVAGANFGCGSSREYAPLALKRRQIGAIISGNFARIFFRNAVNLGIPIFNAPEVVVALEEGDEVEPVLEQGFIRRGGQPLDLPVMPEFTRQIVGAHRDHSLCAPARTLSWRFVICQNNALFPVMGSARK